MSANPPVVGSILIEEVRDDRPDFALKHMGQRVRKETIPPLCRHYFLCDRGHDL